VVTLVSLMEGRSVSHVFRAGTIKVEGIGLVKEQKYGKTTKIGSDGKDRRKSSGERER